MRAGQVNRQRHVGRDLPSAQTLQRGPLGGALVGPDCLGPKLVPPPHASWVNQVELFFSILQRQCLRNASVRSVEGTFAGYPLQAGGEAASRQAA
jgi:hypothetical protein